MSLPFDIDIDFDPGPLASIWDALLLYSPFDISFDFDPGPLAPIWDASERKTMS